MSHYFRQTIHSCVAFSKAPFNGDERPLHNLNPPGGTRAISHINADQRGMKWEGNVLPSSGTSTKCKQGMTVNNIKSGLIQLTYQHTSN